MPALLGFVSPPAPPPAYAPPPPRVANSPKITNGPIKAAKPITGGSYPKARPSAAPPPPPPPPASVAASAGGAAAGLSIGSALTAMAIAIASVLIFDAPLSKDQGNIPQPAEPSQPIEPPTYSFTGGQDPDRNYEILCEVTSSSYFSPPGIELSGGAIAGRVTSVVIAQVFLRIDSNGRPRYTHEVQARNDKGELFKKRIDPGNGEAENAYVFKKLVPLGNGPDNFGNPPPTSPGINSPPGNTLGAPSAAPPSNAPSPAPRAPGISGSPASSPGSLPGGSPGSFPSPSPTPNPGPTPQPDKYPGGVPSPSPNPYPSPNGDPAPSPGPGVGAPSPSPTPAPAPKPGPIPYTSPPPADPTKYPEPGFQPKILQPNPLTPNPLTPSPLNPSPSNPNRDAPSPFIPNPGTGNPEPKAPPKVKPPKTPTPTPSPNDDLFKQIQNLIGPVTIALAGITALVQPDKLRDAAEAGSCRSFAPGGCNANIGNNAQAAANNSAANNVLLARMMAFLEALQTIFLVPILAGVNLINTKLGPVMAGVNGIGGFLARTAEAAKIDKLLGALNTILLLHNAAMLSRNLGSTLGDLTSQALSTIGIKDSEGSPIDVNEILGKQANSFMESLLGAEVWAGTKTSWNKASSIVSSATNIMYTVRSMFDSTREILEWTAENTGKIGNALKRFRVVGENAYKWLPERVTVQNRFTRQVDRFREGVDELDDAASSLSGVLGEVQSIQQEYADLQEQKQKFDKNISELTPKEREENKPVTDAVTAAKNASKAPTEIENVFRGEGASTDA